MKLLTFIFIFMVTSTTTGCTSSPSPGPSPDPSPESSPGPSPASGTSSGTGDIVVSTGRIDVIDDIGSKLLPGRRVYVWLPDNFSAERPHQVLYMHDGQMLFDATSTWNNQEWGVDEVAGQLMAEGKTRDFIVVATDNAGTPTGRWLEYFPQRAVDYLEATPATSNHALHTGHLGADRYLRFIVEELKPYIAKRYAVSTAGTDSFVMGSSMGGLISLYAISEYPDEFVGAACMSTHWPGVSAEEASTINAAGAFYTYMRRHLPPPATHRLYFDHGTDTLDALYPPLQKRADVIMREKGFDEGSWETRVFEGHAYDEYSWRRRLDVPLVFLFGG